MKLPLDLPWSVVLAAVSNMAFFYLGVRLERWRSLSKYRKLVKKSQHAWDDWTEEDIAHELGALPFLERSQRPPEKDFNCPFCNVPTVHSECPKCHTLHFPPRAAPVSFFGERLEAAYVDMAKDSLGYYEAVTGQEPPKHMLCPACGRLMAVHMKGQPCK